MARFVVTIAALLLASCATSYDVVNRDGSPLLSGLNREQATELASEVEANDGRPATVAKRSWLRIAPPRLPAGFRWSYAWEEGGHGPFILYAASDEFAYSSVADLRAATVSVKSDKDD